MIDKALLKNIFIAPVLAFPVMAALSLPVNASAPGEEKPATKVSEVRKNLCSVAGNWVDPKAASTLPRTDLFPSLAKKDIVLLGESHDNADHHRWHLQTLAELHSRSKEMVIGFEMFPRRVQPVLDKWIRGELSEEAFLKEVEWFKVWGFNPGLYTPILHFARQNQIPIVALNVERSLISKVGKEGWAAIPKDEREGVSDPFKPSSEYVSSLAGIYLFKQRLQAAGGHGTAKEPKHPAQMKKSDGDKDEAAAKTKEDKPKAKAKPKPEDAKKKLAEVMKSEGFKRFVQAQLTWDRAMAQKLAEAKRKHPNAVVAGIIGSGHLNYFRGVPYQLADLGFKDSAVLLPVSTDACETADPEVADALFLVASPPDKGKTKAKPRMLLGVMISKGKNGVKIIQVVPDSVAEAAKLQAGDLIRKAAGVETKDLITLRKVIARQAPGTWLPLVIGRGGKDIEVIAKFGQPSG